MTLFPFFEDIDGKRFVVIGGGSVVVKDIPSDCVAVGNPCKPIRKITDEDMKTCFDKSMNK